MVLAGDVKEAKVGSGSGAAAVFFGDEALSTFLGEEARSVFACFRAADVGSGLGLLVEVVDLAAAALEESIRTATGIKNK